jgi:hypothetical protein
MAKQSSAVFQIATDGKAQPFSAKQIAAPQLLRKYASLNPVSAGGKLYLFGYDPAQAQCDVYAVSAKAPCLSHVAAKPAIGKAKDIINTFMLGNVSYLAAYTAKKGIFDVYSVGADLSLSQPYKFYRNHELAISLGFTTVKPFSLYGQVYFLGYRGDTGYVAMYSASTIVSSPAPDVPPLQMLPIWSHPWAAGWTRFAFFPLGGETFFLKTNTKILNVNIDHVLDSPASGTTEVGTLLQSQLPDALNLTNVEPLLLGKGDPHFVTYRADTGAATLNRIHGDCLGWTQLAQFSAPAKMAVVTPVSVGDQNLIVFA